MTYRPKHLDRRTQRRRRLSMAAVAVTAAGSLFAASPADAIGPTEASFSDLVVTADDSNSVGRCSFHIKSTDYSSGTAVARLKSSARPSQLLQAGANASVRVRCELFETSSSTFLAGTDRTSQGAYMTAQAETFTVPIVFDYTLCTTVVTQLKSGDVTLQTVCNN